MAAVNVRLGRGLLNAHDVLCVRRVHNVDLRDEFFHKTRFGSPQYSDAFIGWLVSSYESSNSFFSDAKDEYRQRQSARRERS